MKEEKISVLLVEDDDMAARHLASIVENSGRYHLADVIECATMAEAYCLAGGIDLVLMDICTAMDASGIEAAVKIKKSMPAIRVVIVTSQLDADLVTRARAGQVDSFVYKLLPDEEILRAMDRTAAGEQVYPAERPNVRLGNIWSSEISWQHMNVLRELVGGQSDEAIAAKLHLSVYTVKKYIAELKAATGIQSRTRLAVQAQKLGIVTYGY